MNLELRLRRNAILTGILGMFTMGLAEMNPVWLLLIVGVSAAAWIMERRDASLSIGRTGLNAILLGAVGFAAVDYAFIAGGLIVSLAHFLLIVQFAKLLLPKARRDFGQIYLISLMNVAVGAVVATDILFAAALVFYSGAIIRGMIYYHLYRELASAQNVYLPDDEDTSRPTRAPEMRRVLSHRFLFTLGAVIVAAWIANALFFALVPRLPGQLFHLAPMSWFNRFTGFSDSVTLGDIGRVMENGSPVMHVEIRNNRGEPERGAQDLYFRGLTYQHYDGKRWKHLGPEIEDLPGYHGPNQPMRGVPQIAQVNPLSDLYREGVVRQDIRLEPIATASLFTLQGGLPYFTFPDSTRISYDRDGLDDTYTVVPLPTGPIHYQAWSARDGAGRLYPPSFYRRDPNKPAGGISLPADVRAAYMSLPDTVTPTVRALAQSIIASDPPLRHAERARRIEAWLKEHCAYSLDLKATPGVEPVENFLFNQKKGHCEYFASSMVVLLRAAGVPARLVTGFHGGEWNEVGGWYLVKQSDAHAWVEAWFDGDGWVRFDPTPAAERERGVASKAMGPFGQWLDYFRSSWINNVVQFDQEQQSAMLRSTREATRRFTDMGDRAFTNTLGFFRAAWAVLTDLKRLSTTEGALILLGAFAVSAVIVLTARWLIIAFARRMREHYDRRRARRMGHVQVAFYHDLQRLLKRRGFLRRDHETPAEFADALADAFGPATDSLRALTDAYYRVRFGGAQLTPDDERTLRAHLDLLRTTPLCRA